MVQRWETGQAACYSNKICISLKLTHGVLFYSLRLVPFCYVWKNHMQSLLQKVCKTHKFVKEKKKRKIQLHFTRSLRELIISWLSMDLSSAPSKLRVGALGAMNYNYFIPYHKSFCNRGYTMQETFFLCKQSQGQSVCCSINHFHVPSLFCILFYEENFIARLGCACVLVANCSLASNYYIIPKMCLQPAK